jgi:hypothetical protein
MRPFNEENNSASSPTEEPFASLNPLSQRGKARGGAAPAASRSRPAFNEKRDSPDAVEMQLSAGNSYGAAADGVQIADDEFSDFVSAEEAPVSGACITHIFTYTTTHVTFAFHNSGSSSSGCTSDARVPPPSHSGSRVGSGGLSAPPSARAGSAGRASQSASPAPEGKFSAMHTIERFPSESIAGFLFALASLY